MRIGIVGLPNVGKSTLFNALTAGHAPAENYPFTTIEPNVGVAVVPDPRLPRIAEIGNPAHVVPATIEFVDIAGLVEGASHGEGLGNQFLHHIREVDAIAHVVRCFADADVAHVAGAIDPVADLTTVETELVIADLESVERSIDKVGRKARAGDKEAQTRLATLEKVEAHLSAGDPVRSLSLSGPERVIVRDQFLLTAKPAMYIANVGEDELDANPCVDAVRAHAEREGADLVVVAAGLEAELAGLEPDDRDELLAGYGLDEPGLDKVIRAAYHLLDIRTFFTMNPKEARAWTIPTGTRAAQAAGRVHTDFERGFIKAEVASFDDFDRYGGEHATKEAGRWHIEGRDYEVQEGDVILFRFNA